MELSSHQGQDRESVPQSEGSGLGEADEPRGCLRVLVEGSIFTVDRALLGQNSGYFSALFRSGMKESRQDEVHLQGGFRARGFLIAMAVVRGESPHIRDPDELVDAVECAAFLQVDPLVQHLKDHLDTDNCLLLYQAAAVFGVRELFHSCALAIRDAYCDLQGAAEQILPEEMIEYVESLSPASFVALGTHSPSMKMLQDSFRTVCYLDEELRTWKHLTDLPIDASTSMAGVAVLDNRLYVIGGVRGVSKETVDLGFCFDVDSGSWSVITGPQQSRYNFTLLAHEGRLYAVGGEYEKKTISSTEAFDVSAGQWTSVRHTPRPVAAPAGAVARRRMFVCFWRSPDTTDIYEYVATEDEWTLCTTMVRPQSYGHCMVAHRDKLYVMRNGPSDDFLRCLMDCYNISTGQWSALPGHYVNSKGALFTATVRGDSVFTVNRMLTLEYRICNDRWEPRTEMRGFPKSGSVWTCSLRLPRPGEPHHYHTPEEPQGPASNGQSLEDSEEVHQPT